MSSAWVADAHAPCDLGREPLPSELSVLICMVEVMAVLSDRAGAFAVNQWCNGCQSASQTARSCRRAGQLLFGPTLRPCQIRRPLPHPQPGWEWLG